ncbi:MAG: hypothetical protein MJZ58_01960, partial [Paludibacteraceae bacterium]|nr:hypothetical protein [Paludibacteraceae bacterium]
EHYDAERTTIGGVAGYKLLANDGEHYLFLPDGDYWASTSSSDLVGEQKTAEACQVKVAEEGGLSLLGNALRTEKMMVRLVYETDDPGCLVVSDQRNNSPILAKFKENGDGLLAGQPVDVEVIRSLTPNMSNTLTLPFDVEEGEMAAVFGEGYKLWQLDEANTGSIDVEAQEFAVNLLNATSIEAGVPYLITPTQTVNNMHFNNRVIKVATNAECIAGEGSLVEFHGLLDKTHLTAGDKSCLFLYPNNTLVWSAEGDNSSMNSLRAYFKVNAPAGAPLRHFAPRMVVTSPSVTTDNSQITIAGTAHKILKDGQLMIERDTIVLNLFGQRIK